MTGSGGRPGTGQVRVKVTRTVMKSMTTASARGAPVQRLARPSVQRALSHLEADALPVVAVARAVQPSGRQLLVDGDQHLNLMALPVLQLTCPDRRIRAVSRMVKMLVLWT